MAILLYEVNTFINFSFGQEHLFMFSYLQYGTTIMSFFNGISTFLGKLMPKQYLKKNCSDTI